MIVREFIEKLKGFQLYAARDCDDQLYLGNPADDGDLFSGKTLISNRPLANELCQPLKKRQKRRILSINFETGIVEYEASKEELDEILRNGVAEWCQSMIGRRSPTDAEEKLWGICHGLGLTKETR